MGRQHALREKARKIQQMARIRKKGATPRGTLLAASDILIAAHGKF